MIFSPHWSTVASVVDEHAGTLPETIITRQHVIEEIEYERTHLETLPEKFKYHASARWRLAKRYDLAPRNGNNMRREISAQYVKNAAMMSLTTIAAELREECCRGKKKGAHVLARLPVSSQHCADMENSLKIIAVTCSA